MEITQHRNGTITLKNINFHKLSTLIDGYHHRICDMLDYANKNIDSEAVWSWAMSEVENMQKDRDQLMQIQEKLTYK
jgi:hypothetical protein